MHMARPVFTHSPSFHFYGRRAGGGLSQMAFNNDDRAPVHVPAAVDPLYYGALFRLMHALRAPSSALRFRLAPHQLLCTVNWRVMHGRTAFSGERTLMGGYIDMQDFRSRLASLTGRPF
eukprot:TRINITY_DN6905_c0_g3_i1.p2 TRINITY_DN6905_c0_g3~~TRINITY_DN6905_c0_g3_i1.p2  ORF type:complete len:119 (+),score=40.64 TRINITY_DN6905_c0_g3_i1:452-808(+)